MNNISIIIGKKKHNYEGPSCYDECSAEQFKQLVKIREMATSNVAVIFLLFRVVYRLKERVSETFFNPRKMRKLNIVGEDEQDEVTQQGLALLQTCDWVFEGNPPEKWLIPSVQSHYFRYVGPLDRLSDFTFEQFWYAELYYSQDNFAKMMAVLYREHPRFLKKKEFEGDKIDENAKYFARFESLKSAIYFNYEGCRRYLAVCFPHVFKSGEGKGEKAGNWLDVAIGMAGDDPIKFNALKKENMYIVLKMLDNSLAQIEKLKTANGANS